MDFAHLKGVLQFKGLLEIWSHRELSHMLRTRGNYTLILRDCKVLPRNTWRRKKRARETFCAVTKTYALTLLHTDRHTHCGKAEMEVKEHSNLLLCRVPLWPVSRQRERGCLATSHLHGLPHQQGERPFRFGNLCVACTLCGVHHQGVASQTLERLRVHSFYCSYS